MRDLYTRQCALLIINRVNEDLLDFCCADNSDKALRRKVHEQ